MGSPMATSDGGVWCSPRQVRLRADAAGALKSHQGPDDKHDENALPAGQAVSGCAGDEAPNGAFKVCELTVQRELTRSKQPPWTIEIELRRDGVDMPESYVLTRSASIKDLVHVRLSHSSDKRVATPGHGSVEESPPASRTRTCRRGPRESDVWPRLRGIVPRI